MFPKEPQTRRELEMSDIYTERPAVYKAPGLAEPYNDWLWHNLLELKNAVYSNNGRRPILMEELWERFKMLSFKFDSYDPPKPFIEAILEGEVSVYKKDWSSLSRVVQRYSSSRIYVPSGWGNAVLSCVRDGVFRTEGRLVDGRELLDDEAGRIAPGLIRAKVLRGEEKDFSVWGYDSEGNPAGKFRGNRIPQA